MNAPYEPRFSSFWMGGFESASHRNRSGQRVDILRGTQHHLQAEDDYRRLIEQGIGCAREGFPWNEIDSGHHYDFRLIEPLVAAAQATGLEVQWTLCHYGYPPVDIFSPDFVQRFVDYTAAVHQFFSQHDYAPRFFAPMNEISFFAWAGSRDLMAPYAHGEDHLLKLQLCRAAIEASRRLLDLDPSIRLIHSDPIIHAVAPPHRPDLGATARIANEAQFEAWDIIAGYRHPELGGSPRFLDILGVNFYHANQWEIDGVRLAWEEPRDVRWKPLHRLLQAVWSRYGRPLFLSETSHFGEGRAAWLDNVAGEALEAIRLGVPLKGICLYPVIDRFDWDDPEHWHNAGLWDLDREGGTLVRRLNQPYAGSLARAQRRFAEAGIC